MCAFAMWFICCSRQSTNEPGFSGYHVMRAMQFNSWLLFVGELCLWRQQARKNTATRNIHIPVWNIQILNRIKQFAVEYKAAAGFSEIPMKLVFSFCFRRAENIKMICTVCLLFIKYQYRWFSSYLSPGAVDTNEDGSTLAGIHILSVPI